MKTLFANVRLAGYVMGIATVMTLTGCADMANKPRYGQIYEVPRPATQPVFDGKDDYVYKPEYAIYYGSRSGRYYYLKHGSWVSGP